MSPVYHPHSYPERSGHYRPFRHVDGVSQSYFQEDLAGKEATAHQESSHSPKPQGTASHHHRDPGPSSDLTCLPGPSPEAMPPCPTVQGTAVKVPSLKASSGTGSASRVGFDTKKEVSRVCFIINKEKTTRTTSPSSINKHWSESKQRQTKMERSSLRRCKAPDVMSLGRRVCLKCPVQWALEINQKPFDSQQNRPRTYPTNTDHLYSVLSRFRGFWKGTRASGDSQGTAAFVLNKSRTRGVQE